MKLLCNFLLVAVFLAVGISCEDAEDTIILTKENFDEQLKTSSFFVKFYAPW